jgi:hypothetical protein
LNPSHAKVRSTIHVRPATLNNRCLRLTICRFHPSRRSCRASLRLSCPASATMVRMVGQSGASRANIRSPARRSDMLAGSTRLVIGRPRMSTRIWRFLPFTRLCPSNPRTPPRSVVFTDWPSMMARVGSGFRSAAKRARGYSARCSSTQTPATRQFRKYPCTVGQGGKSLGSCRHWQPVRSR